MNRLVMWSARRSLNNNNCRSLVMNRRNNNRIHHHLHCQPQSLLHFFHTTIPAKNHPMAASTAAAQETQKSQQDQSTSDNNAKQENEQEKKQKEQAEKQQKKQRRRRRAAKLLLFLAGSYVVIKTFAYIVLISEDNAFVMNNSAESLMKKLPLNALSRTWGWIYSTEVPEVLRPLFYQIYAWLFDANLDDAELPLKRYKSLQDFFTRRLKKDARIVDEKSEIVSPVDGRVMSCGVVHINKDSETVVVEQVKGITYPLHHFLGYGMKDAMLALSTAATDVVKDEKSEEANSSSPPSEHSYFLSDEKHEKSLHYCVLYLAPGDYHRFHSPCDWKVEERKHVAGYLFPVMPLFVKTLRGLFALNERVVLHGKWKHGDFHYVLVGATNVGGMTLYFDNTLNTNLKRKKEPKKKASTQKKDQKKTEAKSETADKEKTTEEAAHEITVVSTAPSGEVVTQTKEEIGTKNNQHAFDQYLQMRRREYARGGISLSKGEDIGYFRMGSTVVMLFEHSDAKFEWGIKPGERVLLGEPLSADRRSEFLAQRK